jgi:TolB-like protein
MGLATRRALDSAAHGFCTACALGPCLTDIFLSYNRDDLPTARRFAEAFEREGFSVWWDQTLDPGEHYDHVTEKALKEARAVVVLWSKKSVESRWVRAEATLADRNKTLVPVMIESCDRPIMFELTHTSDLSLWNGDRNDKTWQAFLASVRRFVAKDAAVPPSVAQPAAIRPKGLNPVAITIAVAGLVVAGVVLWAINRAPGPSAKPATTAATAASAAATEVSLAVLPFADMSPAHDQEYYSDGLSEEILNQLAQVKGLTVTARTSSFSFKGKNEDMRVIGEKLGVANLLEGSVRRNGDQLRITAQLINSKTGTHLWSQTYERESKDVFAVQEDIAKEVAKALSIKLDVGDMPRSQGGTTNLEAYDRYLRGMAAFRQTDIVQARQRIRDAVALDPGFVEGWWVLFALLDYDGSTVVEKAKILDRLEALAPGSWHALLARGMQLGETYQWSKAETAFEAAMAVAPTPGFAPIALYHSVELRQVGRVREAHEIWQPSAKANPLSLVYSDMQQYDLHALGRSAEGLTELERSKTLVGYQGANQRELLDMLRFGKQSDAAVVWTRYSSVVKQNPFLQKLFTNRSDNAAVRAVLHQAFDDPANLLAGQGDPIAEWADYFGDRDLALAALRRGYLERKNYSGLGLWLPWRTNLRTDPKFKDIVRGLGLVDYWRATGNWGDFCKPIGKDDFECH